MFSPADAAHCLKAEILFADPSVSISSASIDSRTIRDGELFIPLTGNNCDGHLFLNDIFQKGAGGALVARSFYKQNAEKLSAVPKIRNLLIVENPREALDRLAAWQREQFQGYAIGVTGSIGKTSTKEILGYLLKRFWPGIVTQGNQNNELGLPLTLLRLDKQDRFCLAELGANHIGEIRRLADKLKPTHAILTQVSEAHIEGFGSLQGVYDAKTELLEGLGEGAPGIIPDNDPKLLQRIKRLNRKWIKVGYGSDADYRISQVRQDGNRLQFTLNEKYQFIMPAPAAFFARNAAYALAAAEMMGLGLDQMPREWTDLTLPSGRFEIKELESGVRVIYDGYNASPASFEASLKAFDQMSCKGRKIIVFADMLELGSEAENCHRRLGEQMSLCRFDLILGYGPLAPLALKAVVEKTEMKGLHFMSSEELSHYLQERLQPNDTLLLKASRGMRIDHVLKRLEQKTAGQSS